MESCFINSMSAQKLYMPFAALLLFVCGGFSFYCTNDKADNFSRQNMIVLTAKIDLPNVNGRIDHIAYDSFNHLAFIAALGNNTIEVVNINTKQVVHTIKGLHEPQGVAFMPSLQRLVVANGDNGDCVFLIQSIL
jgi:DNA-binding beta-propeller fold protein YncE